MTETLLIREVPEEIRDWIREEKDRSARTQNEVLLDILNNQYLRSRQMPLFPRRATTEGPSESSFTFVDLFAGIGGLRLGLERTGGRCLFSCEWDRWAQKTYHAWFGEKPWGDIRQLDPKDIPDHDVLAAGFPCQPFSIAGVSKKKSLGRDHGFQDEKQGNLFFVLADIIRAKRPAVLLLENVKNLKSHDGGRTWKVIEKTLTDLGYIVRSKIIDAAGWVPQHRERIFIVCFDPARFGHDIDFEFPSPPQAAPALRNILEPKPDARYTLSKHLWQYLQDYAAKHKAKGNGFGYGLADLNGVTRTLSARYYKDGSEILVPQKRRRPRRLTPRECARLMGFPDNLEVVVSDTQAYRQFGNAVVPLVAEAVGREIAAVLREQVDRTRPVLGSGKASR